MRQYITEIDELEENAPFKTVYNNIDVVIYKTSKGIFAIEDRCSHEEFPLSESIAVDNIIECQKHGSRFDLSTGAAITLPALLPVKTFKVIIEENKVFIEE